MDGEKLIFSTFTRNSRKVNFNSDELLWKLADGCTRRSASTDGVFICLDKRLFNAAKMLVGFRGDAAAARSPFEKAELDEVGLVDVFDGGLFFGECGAEGVEADGAPAEFFDKYGKERAVGRVKTELVHAEELQCIHYRFFGERMLFDLREIAGSFQ